MVERLTAHWYGRITRSGRAAAATLLAVILLMIGGTTVLQAAVDAETQFVFNTFSFLVWGALVMWMCAGFTMLESGSVRTKDASVICLKNIGLYAIAGLAYYFIGYNLMYVDVGSLIGSVTLFYGPSADEVALLAGQESARDAVIANNYAVMSNWFFQMVFVATAASIVSGALAGLVAITAGPTMVEHYWAVIIGAIGAFVFAVSWLLWTAIEKTIGVRVTYNVEQLGQDAAELGIEAYPEFVLMPEPDDTE